MGAGEIVVLVGATAFVLFLIGASVIVRRRQLADGRLEAQRRLVDPQRRVARVREQNLRIEAQSEFWSRMASGETLDLLRAKRRAVRDASSDTEAASARLGAALPNGARRASRSELAAIDTPLEELAGALRANEAALNSLMANGALLDRLRISLPAKKDLLVRELAAANDLARRLRAQGWRVDEAVRELGSVDAMVRSAEFFGRALDLVALSDKVEAAEARLFAATHDLQSLTDRPGSIERWRRAQHEAATADIERSNTVEAELAEVGARHDPESWDWALDHPKEARALLDRVMTTGADLTDLAQDQDFDEAARVLERAGLELAVADGLLDDVDDLLVDLRAARVEAPGIIAESRLVLGQFEAFVREHRADVEGRFGGRPDELERAIDMLDAELRQPRPNYLRAVEVAEHLNRELDELIVAAADRQRENESRRRQIRREVSRASRNIRRARQSLKWELFPSPDTRALSRLESSLEQLPVDLSGRLLAATRIADQAVELRERIIAKRHRDSAWFDIDRFQGSAPQRHGASWSSGGPGGGMAGMGVSRMFQGGTRGF